ncbi:hypothetical protein QFZ21_003029 [Microbacterium sp. W4I20]|nr:hypothetical protein [Microbacterium sp. W4I20]
MYHGRESPVKDFSESRRWNSVVWKLYGERESRPIGRDIDPHGVTVVHVA